MTKKELIEKLEDYSDDEVIYIGVSGYGGYTDCEAKRIESDETQGRALVIT